MKTQGTGYAQLCVPADAQAVCRGLAGMQRTRSVPPGFLMMWMDSRLVLPFRRMTASTASSAKWSLSCVRILLLSVVRAMLSRSCSGNTQQGKKFVKLHTHTTLAGQCPVLEGGIVIQ